VPTGVQQSHRGQEQLRAAYQGDRDPRSHREAAPECRKRSVRERRQPTRRDEDNAVDLCGDQQPGAGTGGTVVQPLHDGQRNSDDSVPRTAQLTALAGH